MNYSSVLIVTYGRTGSTLLMGILNSIPGVLVRGENLNLCAGLYIAYRALIESKQVHGKFPQDSTMPFYGADLFDSNAFIMKARGLLKRQLVPPGTNNVTCWGFKEIRYLPTSLQESGRILLPSYLDFLNILLPKPAFVFLTRDHEQVQDSFFWKNHESEKALEWMDIFEEQAKRWSTGRANCYWVDYAHIVKSSDQLVNLFRFLGAEYEPLKVQDVVSKEHSFTNKAANLVNVQTRRRQAQSEGDNSKKHTNVGHKWQIQIYGTPDMAGVAMMSIDVNDRSTGRLGGVVLLEGDRCGRQLLVVAEGVDYPVQWDIPSPRIHSKYPNYPDSGYVRFVVVSSCLKDVSAFKLVMVDDQGERKVLADCVVNLKIDT